MLLIIVICLALIFDFINGFHDAANSIATIVSTRVLTVLQAVIWAAFFNFVVYFIFQNHAVASTIATIVDKNTINLEVIIAALIAAIIWNLITWAFAIPSSSSHTLIGAFAGAAVAKAVIAEAELHYFDLASIAKIIDIASITKIILFIFLAPLFGMFISIIINLITLQRRFIFKLSLLSIFIFIPVLLINFGSPIEKWGLFLIGVVFIFSYTLIDVNKLDISGSNRVYKKLQLFSSAIFSIGHGGTDAQKVMGIIGAALLVNGEISNISELPHWVPISCYIAIALGTLMGGGRILKTMGSKITRLTPVEGVCAETAGAITLFTAANLGIPVSTTHTITGAIVGVGAIKRLSAVRWQIAINMFWAWIITIPISATLASIIYYIMSLFI